MTKGRLLVCNMLKKMKSAIFLEPKGAFYVFPRLIKVTNSTSFCKNPLIEAKVAIVLGIAFGKIGKGHVRISYAMNIQKLKEDLLRMACFFE